MSDIRFKKPDGSYVTVDSSEAQAAQQRGYEPVTPEQEAAGAQTGLAAVEGVARGASMGFGEEVVADLENAFSPQTGGIGGMEQQRAATLEQMRLRKQENPKLALGTEIAGAVGMSALTGGGPSALVGGGFRGAMLEGGLAGLGAVVSESSLDRSPLTIEKMAAGMAGGTLAAGGIHGTMSVLGKGVSVGLKKLGGGTLSDMFKNGADEVEWRALTKGMSPQWIAKNVGRKEELLAAGRASGSMGGYKAGFTPENAALAEAASHAFEGKISGHNKDLERLLPLAGNDPMRFKVVKSIDDAIDAEYGRNPVFDDAVRETKQLTSKMVSDPKLTWPELWEIQSSLWKKSDINNQSPAMKQVRETMRQATRDFVFDVAGTDPSLPAGFGAAMRKTGREASAAMALSDAFSKQTNRIDDLTASAGNAATGAMISVASGGPGAFVAGLAADVAKNQVRKRGGLVLGSVLRKLGDSSSVNSIANGLQQRIGQVLAVAPNMLGGARMGIEAAFARGAMDLLEEHVRIANGPEGGQYLSSIGMENETPEQVEGVGARLAAMDALHAAQSDLDRRIDHGIDSVLGTKKGPTRPYKSRDTSDFNERMTLMKETLMDPEKAFANVPPELMNGAPQTSAALVDKLLQANVFLNSKAPKDPYEGMPIALKPVWKPAASEVGRWYRYVEAIEQPERMLEKMAQGTFTLEHRDALQAVYPELYGDIKNRMFERLAVWEKPLSYGKKAMLAQFFGSSILGLKPGAIQVLQASFAPKEGDAPASKGGTRPDGREVIDADKNQLTQAQRIEAK